MELGEPFSFVGDAHTRTVDIERQQAADRSWLLDAGRREDILSSTGVFLVAFAVCFVALGVGAYYYALWTFGAT